MRRRRGDGGGRYGARGLRTSGHSQCAAATPREHAADCGPPHAELRREVEAALECYAPVLWQEFTPGLWPAFDRPLPLDADGSGTLADDVDALSSLNVDTLPVTLYGSGSSDSTRLYLFYGLYYPADWSRGRSGPRVDHRTDLEGALVVASRADRLIEAVVTQAHRRFYVWAGPAWRGDRSSLSGAVPISVDGRPVLFAESGGHGVYTFGEGEWKPKGGGRYPRGPAGLARSKLWRFSPLGAGLEESALGVRIEIRPLADLTRFTDPATGRLRGVPRGASPPWTWRDGSGGRSGPAGEIVSDPAKFYSRLLRRLRP